VKLLRASLTALLLLSCNGLVGEVDVKAAKPSLVGKWHLVSVNNAQPTAVNVAAWEIEFHEDGTWSYAGEMSGQFAGMKLSGKGTWSTSGNTLQYTAGDQRGTSGFSLASGQLSLDPDPVIVLPGAKGPVATAYEKTAPARQRSPN
jgi:hypothetical protein